MSPSSFRRCRIVLACLALLPAAGAACTVFTFYPQQMQGALDDFEAGKLDAAYEAVEKEYGSGLNQLLYLLEGGMILHCMGDLPRSNQIFTEANEIIRKYQEKAVVSLGQGTAQVGSLLVNEKTLPYRGEPFERVLVDTYKATNYLFQRDYEGARVEIRRSFQAQQENRRLHEKELERMEKEAGRQGIRPQPLFRDVENSYRDQAAIVARVKNPYEDPFAYYLSAVVYELNREYNDAFIDLKRVEELCPGVPFVQNDLLRMARLSRLTDALPPGLPRDAAPRFIDPKTHGELLLVFGCGMAPRKRQIKITLPIPEVGLVPLAFPKYEPVPCRIERAAVYGAGHEGPLCEATVGQPYSPYGYHKAVMESLIPNREFRSRLRFSGPMAREISPEGCIFLPEEKQQGHVCKGNCKTCTCRHGAPEMNSATATA